MSETRRFASLLQWFSQHPLVGLLSAVTGVVGTILTVWFYVLSIPTRDLVLLEPAVRSVFVNRDAPAVLRVLVHDQEIKEQDVFAVQVAVWNNGNQSIRPENVLEPVMLKAPQGSRIINAQILRNTRGVCGVAAHIEQEGQSARVDWRILERNDGAIVQLVLVGDRDAALTASGTIEGGRPRFVRLLPNSSTSSTQTAWGKKNSWDDWLFVVGFVVAVVWGGLHILFVKLPKHWRSRSARKVGTIASDFAFATVLLGLGYFVASVQIEEAINEAEVPIALLKDPAPQELPER